MQQSKYYLNLRQPNTSMTKMRAQKVTTSKNLFRILLYPRGTPEGKLSTKKETVLGLDQKRKIVRTFSSHRMQFKGTFVTF